MNQKQESIDQEMKGRPFFLNLIHGKLKHIIIIAIEQILIRLKDKTITCKEQLTDSELIRQYDAIQNAKLKLESEIGPLEGRSEESFILLVKLYFTILSHDANWFKYSAYVFDEYRKIREWK